MIEHDWLGAIVVAVLGGGAAVAVGLFIGWLFCADGLIRCPTCGSTKLRQRAGLASFQTPFECENGHQFSYDDGGP